MEDLRVTNKEFQDCKKLLLNNLNRYNEEFYQIQLIKFTKQTAQKYYIVAHAWINYIIYYTDYLDLKNIKISDINSRFWQHVKYEELYDWDKKEAQNKLRVFFHFLEQNDYLPKGV